MLLTLLNNLGTGSVARNGQLDGNAVQPQVHPLAAGAAVFFTVAAAPIGMLLSQQTFGTHASALYNAEAEKSSVWSPSAVPPLLTGVLGTFVGAATAQGVERYSQPTPQIQSAAVAGPGILGAFAWATGQDPTQRAPSVQSAVTAGPGLLGRFTWAWPGQDPTQVPPWYRSAVVAGPGILGAFASITAPQIEANRTSSVWAPLLAAPPAPTQVRFFIVPEQPQDRPTTQLWALVPSSGGGGLPSDYVFGTHAVAIYNAEALKSAVWSAAVTPPLPTGLLGQFVLSAPLPTDSVRSAALQWPAALVAGAEDALGRFLITPPQDPTQRAALTWRLQPFVPAITGRLGSFALVREQPQDRPTYQVWPAFIPGPLVPAGQVAEIVAWAVSQTGIQGARSCFLQGSGCFVYAEYFDYNDQPSTPAAVAYRVDDKLSGVNIVPWTRLVPSTQNRVYVTSAQNSMINLSRQSETHQVLFKVTDGTGDVDYARVLFDLIRAPA